MTEKVVSLSGGLVLGMVFALFLGIGATQHISSTVHFEVPSVMQMTIAQTTHSNSAPASDTTPAVNTTTPANEDSGRITRIATVTETTDPVIAQATTTNTAPKNWEYDTSPKVDNELRRANLLHTSIASNTGATNTYSGLGMTAARENNFVAIAGSSENGANYSGGHTPSFIDSKPQSHGSPAIAQNDPDNDPEDDPSISGSGSAKPGPAPGPDSISDDNTMRQVDPVRPGHSYADVQFGGGSEFNPGSIRISQDGRHKPEFD
ncbi:hypothetical protein DRQ21_06245 [Candidatus Fermentibacteria bacterium]|nr:MAG: hypothetical protein DRQ21_06245 [Candidatus Fermentibacteria bacterium]